MDDEIEHTAATLYLGDETWHDGAGWYYIIDDYPDEGSFGSFPTKEAAIEHAIADGYYFPSRLRALGAILEERRRDHAR